MKTTEENNRIIAEFMGFKLQDNPNERWFGQFFTTPTKVWSGRIEILHFDTSWDWLMPVVERIETLELDGGWSKRPMSIRIDVGSSEIIIDNGVSDSISNDGQYFHVFKIETGGTKKENTYNAVVQFIEWYNKQK